MYLPGTPGDRVADLRSPRKWNQKELAQKIGLSASQVSRIESGETKSISSGSRYGNNQESADCNGRQTAGTGNSGYL